VTINSVASNELRTLIGEMTEEEFNHFINNSLRASGKRCIRIERETKKEINHYTLAFTDIEIDTKKETRLFIGE
jgi:hypothetical protein